MQKLGDESEMEGRGGDDGFAGEVHGEEIDREMRSLVRVSRRGDRRWSGRRKSGEFVGEARRWSEARRRRRARGGGRGATRRRRGGSSPGMEILGKVEVEGMAARRCGGGDGLRTATSR